MTADGILCQRCTGPGCGQTEKSGEKRDRGIKIHKKAE